MYRQILEHRPSSCSNNYHRAIKTQVTDPRDGPRRIRIVFLRIRIQADPTYVVLPYPDFVLLDPTLFSDSIQNL